MALKVQTTPAQAFSADFELQGSPLAGSLTFLSPLGTTAALIQWDAQSARLQTTGEPQRFETLSALMQHTTGTDLPVTSLFAWLQGINTTTPGWEVDLGGLTDGRLSAKRLGPDAPAELKIIFER